MVETQSTEQQQHSEPGQRTSFGGPSPTVARVSPTVIAKAASQEADSQTLGSNGADLGKRLTCFNKATLGFLASQASANRNGCSQRFNESGQVGTAGISKTASLKENLDAAKAVLNMAVNLTAQEVKEPTDVTEPNSARRSFPIKHGMWISATPFDAILDKLFRTSKSWCYRSRKRITRTRGWQDQQYGDNDVGCDGRQRDSYARKGCR